MSWEDEYEYEYVKFDNATFEDSVLYDEVEVLHCKVGWATLEDYTNQWGKESKRITIEKYRRMKTQEGYKFEFIKDFKFYLSMGSRLFNVLKKFHKENPKIINLKILRTGIKFDTMYYVSHFKLDKIQSKLK